MLSPVPARIGVSLLVACACAGAPSTALAAQSATLAERPIVLLVPGSAFQGSDARDVSELVIPPRRWRAWGFATVAVGYGEGRAGSRDVARMLRETRAAHPGTPLCLYGESSGGVWSLLAVARSRTVSCVVAAAAPTDAESWERAPGPGPQYFGGEVWRRYFGPDPEDDPFEPFDVWRALRPADDVLLLYAANDPIVPTEQGRLLLRTAQRRHRSLRILRRGDRSFVHSAVDEGDLRAAVAAVRRFVRKRSR